MRQFIIVCVGVVVVLFAVSMAQAAEPPLQEVRDGTWLRSGIREYERSQNKAESQSSADASRAVATVYYVRGVLDVQYALITKANAQGLTIKGSQQLENTKEKLPQCEVDAMRKGNDYFVPLSKTDFFSANYSMDQYMQVIKTYLEKHPEKLSQHAYDIIEAAMFDAFPPARR
jgi:hypothetical protein